MNSLQYISTQVDSLIGNVVRNKIPEEDEGEELQQQQQIPSSKPELAQSTSPYSNEEEHDESKSQLLEPEPQPPSSGSKEDLSPSEATTNTDTTTASAAAPASESIFVYSILLLPRTLYSVLLFAIYVMSFGYLMNNKRPKTTMETTATDLRHLQSPYNKDLRIPKIQTHFSTKIAFPTRPLLPKFALSSSLSPPQPSKTLVLDLDETLIHSLSRSSSFSQGQMVEIKLDANQLATLYLVNKRPFCDHFLRAVSQWYKLVIFTASVQAYADPMIDWLEQERKYFRRRFYRQHCTSSPAGYIKDLTKVEPDLSKVIIIDNSPISYSMHQNNAISVEGWINDPSDHSLLHLVPLLNALRFTSDIRSLLSLKSGESAFDSEQ